MNELFILHDDNGSFVDYSKESSDFLRDDYNLDFVAIEDSLYIGLYKPFSSLYFEFKTPNGSDIGITLEKSTGAGFTNMDLTDDTKGFQRSGFFNVNRNNENWESQDVNGQSAYWLKLTASNDFNVDVHGLNIVFSDDNDLVQEVRLINDFLAPGDNSFISYHVSSRNDIIQRMRNGGYVKEVDNNDSVFLSEKSRNLKQVNKWDILDLGEIKQASKYLTLAKIFFDNSENVDDKSYQRFMDYDNKFGEAFKLFYMSIDLDDDGRTDQDEKLSLNEIDLVKW